MEGDMRYIRHEQELKEIILSNNWFMEVLKVVRECNPPNWLVGGGVIRNIVWDKLHGYNTPTPLNDIDVAIYDSRDLRPETDRLIQEKLKICLPNENWEVTNQATVHLWYEKCFGFKVDPLESCEEAVATWPETATSIGIRLLEDNSLIVVAPYGLEDLFKLILRRNKKRITQDIFLNRLKEKKICEKWPGVTVIYE